MRILTLVPGGISDQLLFFPTLETLAKVYPQASIDVLVEPRAKTAYKICRHVNEVLQFDYRTRSGLADYLNLLGSIRDREYSIALSLTSRGGINLLLWLNGITTRVGYKNDGAWLLSRTVPPVTGYLADTYYGILGGLDITETRSPLKITLNREDIDWAEMEQKRLGVKDTGYIVIYGGGSDTGVARGVDTVYPLESWVKVIHGIREKQPDLPIVAIEGDTEEVWLTNLVNMVDDVKISRTADIGQMAATIAGANLLLCNDSVPLQLAVAVDTYTIAPLVPELAPRVLPPKSDRQIAVLSPSDDIADITPETILTRLWQG